MIKIAAPPPPQMLVRAHRTQTHLYLALHGDSKENDEIHDEDGPEHRDVQGLKKCAYHADQYRFGC